MLEARTAASGATGRNGGHCRAGRYLEFKDYVERYGVEEALKMEVLEEETVREIGELVRKERIECDLRNVETVDIFTDQPQFDAAIAALEARRKVFEGRVEAETLTKHRVWSEKETREELLIPEGVGAVSFRGYALSPYKLVCGFLGILVANGVNLQTNTPVVEVEQVKKRDGTEKWVVHTERGVVRAEKVILATNAYTSALYPPLGEFLIPTRAQVAAVRPGSNIAGNPALKRTCGLNSAISGDYMQTRMPPFSGAGDIIVGKKPFISKLYNI